MIPAMHTATEKYATTNNTLAMNGTLAMSCALRAPRSSPSNPIIVPGRARKQRPEPPIRDPFNRVG
jgi:hypothetical protein